MPDHSRDLLYLLHDTARLLRVEADKRARATGMTRAQWVLLLRVRDRPGLSQKELSELLEVEPIRATGGSGGCTCARRRTRCSRKSRCSAWRCAS